MYNPMDHYWVVAGSTTQVYSSRQGAYVGLSNADYEEWLQVSGYLPTPIDTEANLENVLMEQYPAGWPKGMLKQQAQAALDKSDTSVLRCLAHGVAVPTDVMAYRAALRAIVNGSDTTSTSLPAAPTDYPFGT